MFGHVVCEVYFFDDLTTKKGLDEQKEFNLIKDNSRFLLSMFNQAYNLLEPELTSKYPT